MHKLVMHGGVGQTLTQLRQTYWLPKGRQITKKIIAKCVVCKKVQGKPFSSVTSPPLPASRVSATQAFQTTGIDYGGPLYVRNGPGQAKVYISLFTCATTRAVHLEIVEDQTAEAFLRAFRRFSSRRGIPKKIITDNAKTFKASAKELINTLNHPTCQYFLSQRGITWEFITERAPWWGGFYERLIGLTKSCLKKVLGKTSLTLSELTTILTEVEATLNSRPLTYPYADLNDEPPLTPSHFLCGYRLLTLPDPLQDDDDYNPSAETNQSDMVRKARHHQKLREHFWRRWRAEYLTSLREHDKVKNHPGTRNIQHGDIVLIHDDTPRNKWKLGVVIKLHPGKDGLTRAATLRTANRRELSRPIEKLYPLEVQTSMDQRNIEAIHEDHGKEDEKSERPQRAAAKIAAQKIKELSH